MKGCHAAALALIAWYPLYPPWNAEKATLGPWIATLSLVSSDDF